MEKTPTTSAEQAKTTIKTFGHGPLDPGAYTLNIGALSAVPLQYNLQQVSFIEAYQKLSACNIVKINSPFLGASFETDAGEVIVSAETGNAHIPRVLSTFIALKMSGIDLDRATWFYYDHDYIIEDPADGYSHQFFLLHDGKIVDDRFSAMCFEPMFLAQSTDKPFFRNEVSHRAAWVAYWYRKFYTETLAGQLMVLRPDKPVLYEFSPDMHEIAQATQLVTLARIFSLLWVCAGLLAVIAFPDLTPYTVIIAAILFVDLLVRFWQTRKLGKR